VAPLEGWLFWASVLLYSIASISFLGGVVFKKERLAGYGLLLCLAGYIVQTAAIALRWSITGHPPIIGDYENALAASWVILGLFLVLQLRFPALRPVGVAVVPFSLLMLGYGVTRSPTLQPLTPVFRSPWLFVHIGFAWLAYGSYVVAAGLASLFLLKARSGGGSAFYAHLPSPGVIDELSYRFIAFGFVADSVMMVAGAIWANSLWGSYWSWDPIQTWSLICWLVYGIYLHLRVIHGWRRERAAWMAIAAIVTVIVSFWATNYLGVGLHVFR
jgi:cytochrome c-type biogenesis protein CcsB